MLFRSPVLIGVLMAAMRAATRRWARGALALVGAFSTLLATAAFAEDRYTGVIQPYGSPERMAETSTGCLDCHTKTDAPTMHENPAIHIGCAECHGGNAAVRAKGLRKTDANYEAAKKLAHVQPLQDRKSTRLNSVTDVSRMPSSA